MSGSWSAVLLILVNVALWGIIHLIPNLKNKKLIFLVLSFVSLLVFLCIREPYSDLLRYEDFFTKLKVGEIEAINQKDWEIGFRLSLYVIRFFTDNTLVLRCFIALATLTGPFLFFKRYSKNYLLTISMFIALGTFSLHFYVLRQAIAVSIFLAAFHLITDKKAIKYCMAIIIAALFHQTAAVLLLIYPLVNVPQSKKKTIVVTVITAAGIIFSPLIANLLVGKFYSEYSDGTAGGGVRLLILYICIYAFYMFLTWRIYVYKRRVKSKKMSKWTKLKKEALTTIGAIKKQDWFAADRSALVTMFWQFFATQNNMFCRLANYTCDSFCVLVPNSIQDLNKKERVIFTVCTIITCICFILITGRLSWYNVMW